MGIICDLITAGEYKGANIKLKGWSNKPTVIYKGLLGKKEITIDKSNVLEITEKSISLPNHQIEIEWKNGKKSLAFVDSIMFQRISAELY